MYFIKNTETLQLLKKSQIKTFNLRISYQQVKFKKKFFKIDLTSNCFLAVKEDLDRNIPIMADDFLGSLIGMGTSLISKIRWKRRRRRYGKLKRYTYSRRRRSYSSYSRRRRRSSYQQGIYNRQPYYNYMNRPNPYRSGCSDN